MASGPGVAPMSDARVSFCSTNVSTVLSSNRQCSAARLSWARVRALELDRRSARNRSRDGTPLPQLPAVRRHEHAAECRTRLRGRQPVFRSERPVPLLQAPSAPSVWSSKLAGSATVCSCSLLADLATVLHCPRAVSGSAVGLYDAWLALGGKRAGTRTDKSTGCPSSRPFASKYRPSLDVHSRRTHVVAGDRGAVVRCLSSTPPPELTLAAHDGYLVSGVHGRLVICAGRFHAVAGVSIRSGAPLGVRCWNPRCIYAYRRAACASNGSRGCRATRARALNVRPRAGQPTSRLLRARGSSIWLRDVTSGSVESSAIHDGRLPACASWHNFLQPVSSSYPDRS